MTPIWRQPPARRSSWDDVGKRKPVLDMKSRRNSDGACEATALPGRGPGRLRPAWFTRFNTAAAVHSSAQRPWAELAMARLVQGATHCNVGSDRSPSHRARSPVAPSDCAYDRPRASRRTSAPGRQFLRNSVRTCSKISVSSWVGDGRVWARVMVLKSL